MSFTNLDTGVGSLPAVRPSVFTPPVALADTPAVDAGVDTTLMVRADVFDPSSTPVITVDPGDELTP